MIKFDANCSVLIVTARERTMAGFESRVKDAVAGWNNAWSGTSGFTPVGSSCCAFVTDGAAKTETPMINKDRMKNLNSVDDIDLCIIILQ
jgi:hypothetical protein